MVFLITHRRSYLIQISSMTLPISSWLFSYKVEKIRNDVSSKDASASANLSEYDVVSQRSLSDFQPLESEDIADIIKQFPGKSCSLDTIPSWLVKRNLDILLPPITKIINASLSTGTFPLFSQKVHHYTGFLHLEHNKIAWLFHDQIV